MTGVTGFVGQALLERALQAGIPVRALTRRPQDPREGVTWVLGDLEAKSALKQLCKGAEAVIHVAGVVNAAEPAGFETGNVVGTLNLITAAVKAGLPRLVHVSSLSVREPQLSAYGASKARAEKLVMASGLDWTIVRPPWVYGPGDGDTLDMFKAARWGVVPVPQREGRSSLIHVDDLARLLLALIPGGEGVSGQTFEPDDGKSDGWSHYAVARAIGRAVGRRPAVVHLSPRVLRLAARISRAMLGTKAKLTPDRAGDSAHPDWVCSPSARVPEALWQPKVPTREGLAATAKWYREQGWM